ncbi:MAG: flagellar hook-basal body complex protein FliE [Acidimicrobiales bacterium]
MSVMPIGAGPGALGPAGAGLATGLTEPTSPTAPTSPLGGSGAGEAAGTFGAGGVGAPAGAGGGTGNSFASVLGGTLDNLGAVQANADNLATQAATGSLTNVADYMVAAEQANISTQLTAAVRNNALQAFQQIMGMQL